jgi:thiol:disulfide interchange protein
MNFKRLKKATFLLAFIATNLLWAQLGFGIKNNKVKWEQVVVQNPKNVEVGAVVTLHFKGKLLDDYYMYATDFVCPNGPNGVEIKLTGTSFEKIGTLTSVNAHAKFDEDWKCNIKVFETDVNLIQKIKILKPEAKIYYEFSYLTCKKDVNCMPGKYSGTLQIHTKPSYKTVGAQLETQLPNSHKQLVTPKTKDLKPNQEAIDTEEPCKPLDTATSNQAGSEMFWYFIASFLAGLATVFMPCIFPLLPMTISYFSKGTMTKAETFSKAGMYGLSIVVIYTAIAILPSMLLGSERVNNWLSTHWLPNAIFFVVFVMFGMSFLGAFEITLPNSWTNKTDKEADKGGYYGLFFMALTLALVSFSCTAPFLSSILILSANGGMSYKPLLGMLTYSSGFATPFVILAMAPQLLSNLPKSGTWMNTMKVIFGILELALALKFLSTIDLVYDWNILDRNTFLGLWAVFAILLSFYLLGIFKMSHDGDEPVKLSVARFCMASITLFATVYLICGIFGKPVTALSGLIPPDKGGHTKGQLCETPKYSEKLHIPYNLPGYFDIAQAKACAKAQNKKVLIDFTGHGCANCRKMEDNIWVDPTVQKNISDEYIIASLYVDDKTELPQAEWQTLADGSVLKTLGDKNLYYENEFFCEVSQPLYVVIDPKTGKVLRKQAYTSDKTTFLNFLN